MIQNINDCIIYKMQINIFDNFFHVRGNRLAYSQKQSKICYHQDIKGVMSMKNYQKAIIEIVKKIHSERALKRIYMLTQYLYSHETGS